MRLAQVVGVNVQAHVLHVYVGRLARGALAKRALLIDVVVIDKVLHRCGALVHLGVLVCHAGVLGTVEVVLLVVRNVRGR